MSKEYYTIEKGNNLGERNIGISVFQSIVNHVINDIDGVDCEFGATAGKVELATCAKKNNLDAIHDTVHEMARDEARHGKALKGLLDRYFGK